jgi:hypothetical protein
MSTTSLPAHAPLSPSAAARWINCPGSINAINVGRLPPPSQYAEEGTRAHTLFARCLLEGRQAAALMDDLSLAAPLQEAIGHARRIIAGRSVLIEQRLPPLPGLPDLWGTADIAVFDQHLRLSDVIDFKFGAYVAVEASTVQTGIYGLLGAARFGLSADGLTTWIIQPRCFHSDGPVRRHHYDRTALHQLYHTVRSAAVAVQDPSAPRRGGAWCRFCPAALSCPEHQESQRQREPSLWSRSTA